MSAKPCEIFQGVSGPFCAHDVQDMRLPELSKTHSSLTGVGRERRGDGNGLYSPGAGCPLSPQVSEQRWGSVRCLPTYASGLMWCKGTPGSPLECGSQNSSSQGACEICKTKWERPYLHSRYEQAEDLFLGSTLPFPPLVPPSFLPLPPPCCACQPSQMEEENTSKACSLWDQGPGQTCRL